MVEISKTEFKVILKLLALLEEILLEVSQDKNNNYLKRRTAEAGYTKTKKLLEKFNK